MSDPDLFNAYAELQKAAAQLMAQFEIEEDQHGFPFNFALRDAHRELKAVLRKHVGNDDVNEPDSPSEGTTMSFDTTDLDDADRIECRAAGCSCGNDDCDDEA